MPNSWLISCKKVPHKGIYTEISLKHIPELAKKLFQDSGWVLARINIPEPMMRFGSVTESRATLPKVKVLIIHVVIIVHHPIQLCKQRE